MNSDIKLEGKWVVLEGSWTRVRTYDIMLDAADRRSNNSGQRRALVHDHNDGLTINWADDYPGGVTINGRSGQGVKIVGNLTASETVTTNALTTESLTIGDGEFVKLSENRQYFVLGDEQREDAIYVQGRGLSVQRDLHVQRNAIFNNAIQTPDVMLTTMASERLRGGRFGHLEEIVQPQSLRQIIETLEQEISQLKERIAQLEGQG